LQNFSEIVSIPPICFAIYWKVSRSIREKVPLWFFSITKLEPRQPIRGFNHSGLLHLVEPTGGLRLLLRVVPDRRDKHWESSDLVGFISFAVLCQHPQGRCRAC
jgi:hypothetical protein